MMRYWANICPVDLYIERDLHEVMRFVMLAQTISFRDDSRIRNSEHWQTIVTKGSVHVFLLQRTGKTVDLVCIRSMLSQPCSQYLDLYVFSFNATTNNNINILI